MRQRFWGWGLVLTGTAIAACSSSTEEGPLASRGSPLVGTDTPLPPPVVTATTGGGRPLSVRPPLTADEVRLAESLLSRRSALVAALRKPVTGEVTPTGDGNYFFYDDPGARPPNGLGAPVVAPRTMTLGRFASYRGAIRDAQRRLTIDNRIAALQGLKEIGSLPLDFTLPSPAALRELGSDRLDSLIKQIVASQPDIPPPPVDPPLPPIHQMKDEIGAVAGSPETDARCGFPTIPWFAHAKIPLKVDVSLMRAQGNRGTCVAFAMMGAAEARYHAKHGDWINLSEQSFYARAKHVWTDQDYGDGLDEGMCLEHMLDDHEPWNPYDDRRFPLIPEADWQYNPSQSRTDVNGHYHHSCEGYSPLEPQALDTDCSNTTHQRELYSDGTYADSERFDTKTMLKWYHALDPSDDDDRKLAQHYLRKHIPIVLGMDVTNRFKHPTPTGRVTVADDDPSVGGHAMMIVGYMNNDELGGTTIPGLGGGYWVIRNSWGCGYAQAGYALVEYEYVAQHGTSMNALSVD